MGALLRQIASMPRAERDKVWRYCLIGAVVFVADVGTFQLLIQLGVLLPVATVAAYALAIVVHFVLNKYINFRSFSRTLVAQARTYLLIQVSLLIVTLLIVVTGVDLLHTQPLVAKAAAIAVNLPLGFLAHRFLTFEAGIMAMYRRLRARRERV